MDIPSIAQDSGANIGGLGNRLLLAEKSWFATMAVAPTAAAYGDQATITGNHTFNTGKGFVEIYSTLGEAELTAKVVGPRDGKGTTTELNFKTPGSREQIAQMVAENKDLVWLVTDADCSKGFYWQLGFRCLGAIISEAEFKTGKAMDPNAYKGWDIKVMAYGAYLTKYTGTVTLYP